MPYIGRPLNAGNLAVQSGTGDGSDTTPIATLDYSVGSSNSIGVYLDGVRQLAGTDFTASGTVLTFTTAPANGVGVDVYFLGLELSIPTPADGTVTSAKIADGAIVNADINASAAIVTSKLVLAEATQAQQEAATETDAFVSPAKQHHHESSVKMWINFNGTGTVAIRDSYNVTSITDNAVGSFTVTIATDFSDGNYCIVNANSWIAGTSPEHHMILNRNVANGLELAPAAGSFSMSVNHIAAAADPAYVYILAMGDN